MRSSPDDAVTLIGAGVTLHACLAAAERLAGDGIRARVIDLYSIKPVDTETLAAAPWPSRMAVWSWPKTTTPKEGLAPLESREGECLMVGRFVAN